MIIVKDKMKLLETRILASCCKQMKVMLDGVSYKRIVFERGGNINIQWIHNGQYVDDKTEKILEKIFSDMI